MNLKGIIQNIDAELVNKFTLSTMQPMKNFGLAEYYYDKDKKFPGIVNQTEVVNPFMEDSYNLSWYHRSQTATFDVVENNFGDELNKVEESTPVQLVVFANRKKMQRSLQEIKDIFVSALPSVLPKSQCESLDIFDCRIELANFELNSFLIFKEECSIDYVRVGIEHGLFAIRYIVKSTYRRGCQPLCES